MVAFQVVASQPAVHPAARPAVHGQPAGALPEARTGSGAAAAPGSADDLRHAHVLQRLLRLIRDRSDGACEWTVLERGRWRFPDHVTLGEGRAVVRSAELAVLAGEHRCKLLQLEDNAPTSGSMTKGRSPAPALNYIARRKAARTLMSDIRMYLPWVESKVMPADEASRIIEC